MLNLVNILLMILSALLATYLPVELFLASYAFLGPAHYLTQIAWMGDKRYFSPKDGLLMQFGLIALVCVILTFLLGTNALHTDVPVVAILISGCFIYAAYLVLGNGSPVFLAMLISGVLAGCVLLWSLFGIAGLAFFILLPTIVHVYVFTGSFILEGALQNKTLLGGLSFLVFLGCGLFFMLAPMPDVPYMFNNFATTNLPYAHMFIESFQETFSITQGGRNVLAFFAFAYTYHYLNWFSKVQLIKWHKLYRHKLVGIIAVYTACIALYLYNYALGYLALLFFSLLHVLLEFPLNVRILKSLWERLRLLVASV